jgi:hypothetical protein
MGPVGNRVSRVRERACRRYRDAVSLQKTANGWRVILPKEFGPN